MNEKQNLILLIIIFCITGLIATTISYSNLSNEDKKESINTSENIDNTQISSSTTIDIYEEEISSTLTNDLNHNKKTTTNKVANVKTTNKVTNDKTTKLPINIKTTTQKSNAGIKDEIEKKLIYYFHWTDDEYRDYTGRNCLFIYDKDGKTVDGYANLLYYGKYRKKQFITKDTANCFLEDKVSTVIESIIVDGVTYE